MSLSRSEDDDEEEEANGNNFTCDSSRWSTSSSMKVAGRWRMEMGTSTSESAGAGAIRATSSSSDYSGTGTSCARRGQRFDSLDVKAKAITAIRTICRGSRDPFLKRREEKAEASLVEDVRRVECDGLQGQSWNSSTILSRYCNAIASRTHGDVLLLNTFEDRKNKSKGFNSDTLQCALEIQNRLALHLGFMFDSGESSDDGEEHDSFNEFFGTAVMGWNISVASYIDSAGTRCCEPLAVTFANYKSCKTCQDWFLYGGDSPQILVFLDHRLSVFVLELSFVFSSSTKPTMANPSCRRSLSQYQLWIPILTTGTVALILHRVKPNTTKQHWIWKSRWHRDRDHCGEILHSPFAVLRPRLKLHGPDEADHYRIESRTGPPEWHNIFDSPMQ
ncbi:hypothetical protein BT96DRAFT_949552 [Gymnopus androsaceus JB14]|uniref:Uncharacterized protein n=1 Tax=Gymnopus androsaceus JB14 TaxID=1447944 RepID=A0A6A4GJN3_9AGAR|nr:hypothetical protein BT96DRAFT_949552 [Gymnopus androsaceus JB14]